VKIPAVALSIEARPTRIHTEPCERCPSANYPMDPQVSDIKNLWSRVDQLESVFPCAWRPEKLCKGYCDLLNVKEEWK
jgi:hypothetical protein